MSDGEASDARIEEVGLAWLRYHATQNESDEWPLDLVDEWIYGGRMSDAWRLIKDVCGRVGRDDLPQISNIGAGPLESFVARFGDRAMDLIEPELGNCPTLLAALAMVLRRERNTPIRPRIDRVLAEHGQERPDLVERASASWLATTAAGKDPDEWVSHLQLDWIGTGQWESMWRYILRLCEIVDPENRETIEMIGADPLTSLMYEFPDQTLQAIEDVADRQPTVLDALSIVIGSEVKTRIDAILARYGKPRA